MNTSRLGFNADCREVKVEKKGILNRLLVISAIFLHSGLVSADTIRVAVASNFAPTLRLLTDQYEAHSKHSVLISSASSGKHYAQVKQGAPFDMFLSADRHRPLLLIDEGYADSGSSFTYAIGRLVLWNSASTAEGLTKDALRHPSLRRLAIANPAFAPYGQAAIEVLNSLGMYDFLGDKLVRGENIAQTFQFVATGNAELGLISYSQILKYWQTPSNTKGAIWIIPENLYTPIRQEAILLARSGAAADFFSYLKSAPALKIIRENGYKTP